MYKTKQKCTTLKRWKLTGDSTYQMNLSVCLIWSDLGTVLLDHLAHTWSLNAIKDHRRFKGYDALLKAELSSTRRLFKDRGSRALSWEHTQKDLGKEEVLAAQWVMQPACVRPPEPGQASSWASVCKCLFDVTFTDWHSAVNYSV